MSTFKPHQKVEIRPTTNHFVGYVVRELTDDEKDEEVGPMYEVTIHVYEDELTAIKERRVVAIPADCTATDVENGFLVHNGNTCPIHEAS